MKKSIFVFILSLFFVSVHAQNKLIVQNIEAQVGNGPYINVYWTLPADEKSQITKIQLYRALKPITNYSQLEKINPIAELSPETTGYTDKITDFNDYYYAVILYTDKPYDLILVSMNSTINGVHLNAYEPEKLGNENIIVEKKYNKGEKRETPLPYIDYIDGENQNNVISDYTVKSTAQFSSENQNKTKNMNPYFFEEDLISPDGGDDFILFEILKTTFVQEKYEEAITELNKLTNLNIDRNVQNRTYFYMAEAQFFIGKYDEAVKNFIIVADVFPQLTKKWINLSLDNMKIPD